MGRHYFFSTMFYSEDITHRLLLLMQMGGAVALAVNIHGAFGDTASGFAASYAFVRFVLVVEYYRQLRKKSAAESKKPYQPLVKRYITGFSCAATIWLVSAFMPDLEIRLLFWAVALMVDFATPITAGKLHSKFAPHVSHLPERMGLFTIIVLGESIVGIITGMAEHVWDIHSVAVVSLGLCIPFCLWWLYFSNAKSSPIQDLREKTKIGVYYTWLYGHFPLVVAITALGAGIGHLVSAEQGQIIKPGDLWLICISVALALIAQSIIHISSTEINQAESTKRGKLTLFRTISIISILCIPVLSNAYSALTLASILTAMLASQIVLDSIYHPLQRKV